jgi:hypothetical protein
VGERLGDGFADIVALAALAPDLPTTGGEITGVTVTLGLQDLERRAGTVLIDGIGCTSLSDLRRRCWDAHIIPTVLGTGVMSSTSAAPTVWTPPPNAARCRPRPRLCPPGC